MKPIRSLFFLLISLGILVLLAGCGAVTPIPPQLTPAAILKTAPDVDLVERALSAVDNLNDPKGFSYTLKSTSFTQGKISKGEETLNESSYLQAMSDKGSWLMQGNQPSIDLQRAVSSPGSFFYPLHGEMRLVDGQTYLSASFDQPKAELPAMPIGWLRVYGDSTLLYWPNIQDLRLGDSLQDIRQGPWSLISGHPSQILEEILTKHLDTAEQTNTTLPDESIGEILSFTIKSSALSQAIYYLGEVDPVNQRLLAAVRGSPITMRFTLDESGRLVQWELKIDVSVKDVDLTGTPGSPNGAKMAATFKQDLFASIWRDPLPTAITVPDPDAVTAFQHYSNPDQSGHFQSLENFDVALNQAISDGTLDRFWKDLSSSKTIPFVFNDLAVFLYRGEAEVVEWTADWSGNRPNVRGRLNGSDVWMHTVRLPLDSRLEYQIRLDYADLILDPINPKVETGGLGSKSVLEMTGYLQPEFIKSSPADAVGTLTADIPLVSHNLGYTVNYRVYTPAGYDTLRNLPVLYVTDGQDFIAFGKMNLALDNLIADGKTQPVMAVFIDPRDVKTGENQRNEQFFDNPAYGKFITDELVFEIDRQYRTNPSPDARLIIGTSNGGYHSLYFVLNHSKDFHLIAAFSPSIWYKPEIIETYRREDKLPLKFFISTGVFNDNNYHADLFQKMLEAKGYPSLYIESNEGHSYGNWRDKFDEMLEFFFPVGST